MRFLSGVSQIFILKSQNVTLLTTDIFPKGSFSIHTIVIWYDCRQDIDRKCVTKDLPNYSYFWMIFTN